MGRTRMGRPLAGLLGLCLAIALAVPAGARGNEGGSGVSTSGSRTDTGAQASVGSQNAIPTTGRRAHRGRGAPTTTCTFYAINPLNPLGATGGEINPRDQPEGTQSWRTCVDTATRQSTGIPTLYTTPPPSSPDLTNQLVDQALANIDIDLPVPHLSPPAETFPNFDTWLWTDDLPTQTASATAAGVTVTVIAQLVSTKYEILAVPGKASRDDNKTITCNGAPTPYNPSRPDNTQRTTCSHRFSAPTRDLTIDTTATWQLAWTATNGTGANLGTVDRTVTTPYRVQEKQTVIRTP